MKKEIEKLLPLVEKPGRYIGAEQGSIVKKNAFLSFAFCFPDTYEIGMSHLGMRILYSLINEREDTRCERVFAPWTDMESLMRKRGIGLFGLESGDEIRDFDVIAFTVQYELCYTNILNMLDLAGLPVKSSERSDFLAPIVIAGGPCACNPEPIADFIDAFQVGEGEEMMNDFLDLLHIHKDKGSTKTEFLREAAKIPGIYVPRLYDIEYNSDGTVKRITPKDNAPEKIKKRVVSNLDTMYFPENLVVPYIEIVHDRVVHEIFRGCIRGCRFCQAGFIYRPVREKSPDIISEQSRLLCQKTGYDEVSLCSLSSSDYTAIEPLLTQMLGWADGMKVNIALPSLRVDNFNAQLAEKLNSVRKSGLTFAPEAGTQRMRDVINKNVSTEELYATVDEAFASGWTTIKLYFMIGLPTETDEDVTAIAALADSVVDRFYNNSSHPKGRNVTVNISVASFVPKPFTPFQWEPQDSPEVLEKKQKILCHAIKSKRVSLSYHELAPSVIEAVFARGDRRLGAVIYSAWKSGSKFDSWDNFFDKAKWDAAFEENGIEEEFYSSRRRAYDEVLPWSHIDVGVTKKFLISQSEKAKRAETTPHCRIKCAGCGASEINGGKCDARCETAV